jgi:hypothetical protein
MEPTSKRAANRREVKQLRKDLQWIKKHSDFGELMQSRDITDLPESDQELLKKNEHTDVRLQRRFNRAMYLLKEVLTKESRLLELTRQPVEDIPDIQE